MWQAIKKSVDLKQLAEFLNGKIIGSNQKIITGISTIDLADENQITFFSSEKYKSSLLKTKAGALLCEVQQKEFENPQIIVPNVPLALAKTIAVFFHEEEYQPSIASTAKIDPEAKIDATVCIMDYVVVEKGAQIGAGSVLYPGVYIGARAQIGNHCRLYSKVSVLNDCVLENRIILHPGVVIGADGFGYASESKEHFKIPQVGNVILEDDVEIGANTCVDRALLGATRIGHGTKIDNLVQIGHNVQIGSDCILVAQVGVAGSTHLGNEVILGGQVGIAGHVKIASKVIIAAQSGVMTDIDTPGIYWGSPIQPIQNQRKCEAIFRELPGWVKRIRNLEKQFEENQK
jgi:UDP-3-O-[3-hydroxymyristoyl] glucosamine N-acyltransferase